MSTTALTFRALAALPPELQQHINAHARQFGGADSLDDAISEAALAWLSGAGWARARGSLRREQNSKFRAASRFNVSLDDLADVPDAEIEIGVDNDPLPRKKKEWVKHIAAARGVGIRRAQQIVAEALKSAQSDLFAEGVCHG